MENGFYILLTILYNVDEEALDDLGRNADLYIFNQDDSDSQQVDDVRSGRQPHDSLQGTDAYNFQFSVA